jgi:short-subunit dehydrogenase
MRTEPRDLAPHGSRSLVRPFRPRHALITGAAGAIGGALARCLGERYPELRLSLSDLGAERLADLVRAHPDRCRAFPWDLSEPATLGALWERVRAELGPVDLLVNCAGFMEIRSFAATSWELGQRLLNVDLLAPLRLMKLAVDDMLPHGGWVVNISSMAGRVPLRGCSYYGAAKSGLVMASEIAGLELAPRGVHVLTVLPGPVYSELETRARGQVRPGAMSRHIPTGDAQVLAQRIERALRKRSRRLVYPAVYGVADRFIGLSSRFTAAFSPDPTDGPE